MEDIEKKDKRTILVVDDEKPIVEILVYNLQKEGYNTIEANDGEEAIKIALSKLRIQQEKMQELDANILYLKKQREVGEQLENQSKGEDDNGR